MEGCLNRGRSFILTAFGGTGGWSPEGQLQPRAPCPPLGRGGWGSLGQQGWGSERVDMNMPIILHIDIYIYSRSYPPNGRRALKQ